MEAPGVIKAILNEDYVLVEWSGNRLENDSILTVYAVIDLIDQSAVTEIQELVIPKGEIKVVRRQSDKIYAARTYSKLETRTRRIPHPGSVLGIIPSILSSAAGEVITQQVPVGKSAAIKKEQSLGIDIDHAITVGDSVVEEGKI